MKDKITIDIRNMPSKSRHDRIFSTFEKIQIGDIIELINDHDPKLLWYQMCVELPGMFEWDYIEKGPHNWRADIRKTKLAPYQTLPPIH